MRRSILTFCSLVMLWLTVCGAAPQSRLLVKGQVMHRAPDTPTVTLTPPRPALATPAPRLPTATPLVPPTATALPTPVPDWYRVRGGDTLLSIARRHEVEVADILALNDVALDAPLAVGALLALPSRITVNLPPAYLLHDSEVAYGPSYLLWDTRAFVEEQGGYLAQYREGSSTGAEIIEAVAAKYHVGPRPLLAAMELLSGWVSSAQPRDLYAFGLHDPGRAALSRQAAWAAERLMEGYYGQMEGRRDWVVLSNRVAARLYPGTNPGSAAIANLLAAGVEPATSFPALLQEEAFQVTYRRLFGEVEGGRVRPPRGEQPPFALPWTEGENWYFTGGPHGGWGDVESGWAALDFAPPIKSGCAPSPYQVRAIAAGLVIGSSRGETWVDLDEDGDIRTGWVILYMHLATAGRIPAGARVQQGQVIGFPSCEGGHATGAHVHVARMYHGQWMPVDGPVPFQLGEWTAHATIGDSYAGTLTNAAGDTLTACDCRDLTRNRFASAEDEDAADRRGR